AVARSPLSLHDPLPISGHITDRVANPTRQTAKRVSSILGTRPRGTRNLITEPRIRRRADAGHAAVSEVHNPVPDAPSSRAHGVRSEEHTSELQSRENLV